MQKKHEILHTVGNGEISRFYGLATVTQSYIAALLVERFRGTKIAKLALAVSAVAGLGLLAYCKYADFFIGNFNAVTGLSVPLLRVALPVGISFYTFQILSYVGGTLRNAPRCPFRRLRTAAL